MIPTKQCKAIFKLLHEGHLGLNKCKLRAKETVYWHGPDDQLEDLLLNCDLCLKYSKAKCKLEPSLLLGQEVPLYPWTKLATDVFHFEGASYLLIVDYTSRYPVVCKLTLMTGQHIASHFKLTCSEYGWPENMVSDNGPCYTYESFTTLMKEYNVNPITSSPHYPQSNGLAENTCGLWRTCFTRLKRKAKTCLRLVGVSQHPTVKQSTFAYANTHKQICQIQFTDVTHSKEKKGFIFWGLENSLQEWTFSLHNLHLNQVVMYQDPASKRWVSSHYHQAVSRT